jgi:two-component system, LytTR family, sensor kinase
VFSAENATSAAIQGRPFSWQWGVVHEFLYFGVWALCTPLIARRARRHWLEPGSGARPWLAHLATALLLAPLQVASTYLLHGAGLLIFGMLEPRAFPAWFAGRGRSILLLSFTGALYYWVVVGVYYAAAYRRLYLAEQAEAAQASLDALRAQLQPHFLFNTLNSISVLVEENPPAAGRVLLRLSELLRMVIRHDPRHEVPLSEEVASLAAYIEIQRVRFEDRLRITLDIEPAAERALVPWLVLQPLVENAIRHAIEPRAAGGHVAVRATRAGARLNLEVTDDGPGIAGGGSPNADGVGLANTRARLKRLYGESQEMRFESGEAGGFRVMIHLPFREERPA